MKRVEKRQHLECLHWESGQPGRDDALAGGFGFAGTDFPAVGEVRRIVHAMLIVADVVGALRVESRCDRLGRESPIPSADFLLP